jgi:hypothetical protein
MSKTCCDRSGSDVRRDCPAAKIQNLSRIFPRFSSLVAIITAPLQGRFKNTSALKHPFGSTYGGRSFAYCEARREIEALFVITASSLTEIYNLSSGEGV